MHVVLHPTLSFTPDKTDKLHLHSALVTLLLSPHIDITRQVFGIGKIPQHLKLLKSYWEMTLEEWQGNLWPCHKEMNLLNSAWLTWVSALTSVPKNLASSWVSDKTRLGTLEELKSAMEMCHGTVGKGSCQNRIDSRIRPDREKQSHREYW